LKGDRLRVVALPDEVNVEWREDCIIVRVKPLQGVIRVGVEFNGVPSTAAPPTLIHINEDGYQTEEAPSFRKFPYGLWQVGVFVWGTFHLVNRVSEHPYAKCPTLTVGLGLGVNAHSVKVDEERLIVTT
jgi:hypothetical protein